MRRLIQRMGVTWHRAFTTESIEEVKVNGRRVFQDNLG